ncbi:MAG: hypothetical protein CSB55_04910 [Candidatus Cloacimonadota bacterium]|nr:MAG: hypothetical protein CSB55_04910 [Candidatus Cloacimonadota bacterium]
MFEFFGISPYEFQHFLLIYLRLFALFQTFPIFSSTNVKTEYKVFVPFYLALLHNSYVPFPESLPVSLPVLGFLGAKEAAAGLSIGFVSVIFMQGVSFAGMLASRMMGLSMMSMLNPLSDENVNVIGQLKYFIAVMVIFSVNGHHFLLQTMLDSFYYIPVTQVRFSGEVIEEFMYILSNIFITGIKLSAPVYVSLFIERVVLALFSKFTPQMNVMFVAMPAGILLGFYFLMLSMPYFIEVFGKVFIAYKEDLLTFIRLMGA